jgi:transposase-like protein
MKQCPKCKQFECLKASNGRVPITQDSISCIRCGYQFNSEDLKTLERNLVVQRSK